MSIIVHRQTARPAVMDFNGVTFNVDDGETLVLGGSFVAAATTYAIPDGTAFPFAEMGEIYIQTDGTLTTTHDDASYALLCWREGADLHVIEHIAP